MGYAHTSVVECSSYKRTIHT